MNLTLQASRFGIAASRVAAMMLLSLRGAPFIYYGDEIGLDGEHDPDCRKSFPWEESQWDQDLLSYVKKLIGLRKQNSALRRGDFRRLWSADGTYAFSRSWEGETMVVALNTSESPQQVEVRYEAKKNPKAALGEVTDISMDDHRLKFRIPARSGVMLK